MVYQQVSLNLLAVTHLMSRHYYLASSKAATSLRSLDLIRFDV